MKLLNILAGVLLGSTMAVGVGAGVAANSNVEPVGAATNTTIYCAVPISHLELYASPSVACNTNHKGDGDDWHQYTMSDLNDTSYLANYKVFKVNFTDTYDGLGCLHFYILNNGSWAEEDKVIHWSWTDPSTYNGKLWVYQSSDPNRVWHDDYVEPDSYTITKYGVYDNVLDSSNPIGTDSVLPGGSYAVPDAIYQANYVFGGWYSDSALTSAYSATTITEDTPIYAKYTSHANWSGSLNFDLRDTGWSTSESKFAVYFFDETTYSTKVEGWSTMLSNVTSGKTLITIDYSLPFEPVYAILVSFNSTATTPDWSKKVNQTSDTLFSSLSGYNSVIYDSEYSTYWIKSNNLAKVMSGKSGQSWSQVASLSSVKLNGSNHAEYYSTSVALTTGNSFKVVHGNDDYYGYYSCHKSLESCFSGGSGSDIYVVTGGTYAFYFDSCTKSVYITTLALAEADEWAEDFLGTSASSDNCTYTKANWSTNAGTYASLDPATKALFVAEKHVDPEASTSTYLAKAVQRYDHVLKVYGVYDKDTNPDGYVDFMGRVSGGSLTLLHSPIVNEINNQTPVIIIIIASIVGVSAVGGYFFIRRRKHQ